MADRFGAENLERASGAPMWDFIVVGAGSAGCALANRLSQSGANKVLLMEAGPRDDSADFRLPAGAGLLKVGGFDWGYRSAPDPTRNNRSEHWPRGRVLGGSSSINGMIYVRGSGRDFDRWAELGNANWDAATTFALYKNLENCEASSIGGSSPLRGYAGQLDIRMIKRPHLLTKAFMASAWAAGYQFKGDYNAESQEGAAYIQLTQRRGKRCSAADAFLRKASRRSNLHVLTDTYVHRLLVKDACVVGVRYRISGEIREARARRVILCAGVINTPQLLMLSGIGEGSVLQSFGIPVVLDSKAVGRNLLEHPLIRLIYRVKVTSNNLTAGLTQKLSILAKYLLHRQGPLASCFESIAFLRTSATEARPDIQLHFAPLGFEGAGVAANPLVRMLPYPSITILVNKNYPLSKGRVRLVDADPEVPLAIEPRLLDAPEDVETLTRGIDLVRRIVSKDPLAGLISEEVMPGSRLFDAASAETYLRGNVEGAYHPVGTCRMGTDDSSVVTPDLRVKGIENLWIADASVMPELISGNTNAAAIMIGEKLGLELCNNQIGRTAGDGHPR